MPKFCLAFTLFKLLPWILQMSAEFWKLHVTVEQIKIMATKAILLVADIFAILPQFFDQILQIQFLLMN